MAISSFLGQLRLPEFRNKHYCLFACVCTILGYVVRDSLFICLCLYDIGICCQGQNPDGGHDFPYPSRQALGPTQPPDNGYWVFPGGKPAGTWR
jgi:hypothetical protein